MNFEELDIALEELETRLERLRALYEQYFLGFEKIEPQVARKNVDRRIYLLRREKIRNTGKRFKLQTIVMRYNTFQQYWQRICREIENGTYKRHLARAQRVMGAEQLLTIAARRRFGKAAADRLAAQADVEDESPLDEIEAGDLAVGEPFPPELGTDRSLLPAIPRTPMPTGVPSRPPAAVARAPHTTMPPGVPPRTARPSKYESLSLDMDFLDSWNPETSIRARQQGRAAPPQQQQELPMSPPKTAPPPKPASPMRAAPPPRPEDPRVQPPKKPERPAPAPAAASKPSALTEQRIKELHESLVRIKRENKEPGQVSVESLARTLRATEEKLRAEHKNRRIEFEVVLRDGKAVVKPKVR